MIDRRRGPRRREGDAPEEERDRRSRALVYAILALPVLIGFYGLLLWWSTPRSPGDELRLDQYFTMLEQGRIRDATILEVDNQIIGRYDRGRYWVAFVGGRETLFARMVNALDTAGIPVDVEQQPLKRLILPITLILPALIIVDGLVIVFLVFGRGAAGGLLGFGRSTVRQAVRDESRITFKEVAALDEAIEELAEVRDYLSNPERFMALGAAVPKGILLMGPPGCGKTLLARAVAGESEVPFFSISGSDFVEMFVGVGTARIRDTFERVKASAPAIVFIDELDAVGRNRSTTAVAGQDEREATLNQLLVELDGFDSGSGVVVLAATNRSDILDSALLRPGRFDRRITISLPDVRGREEILRIHARGKPISEEADLERVARRTVGFSGADLANVVNEAALLAARHSASEITMEFLLSAVERVVAGPERRSRIIGDDEKRRLAVHEAGHAIVASAFPGLHRVDKVSIVSRGHAGGITWFVPERDQVVATRSELRQQLSILLAGRAAERLVTGEDSSASEHDLERATRLAGRMLGQLGMGSTFGAVSVRALAQPDPGSFGSRAPSEHVAAALDRETAQLLGECEDVATTVLEHHRAALDRMTDALVEEESIEGDNLTLLLGPVGSVDVPNT